jgi:hypothetical protein
MRDDAENPHVLTSVCRFIFPCEVCGAHASNDPQPRRFIWKRERCAITSCLLHQSDDALLIEAHQLTTILIHLAGTADGLDIVWIPMVDAAPVSVEGHGATNKPPGHAPNVNRATLRGEGPGNRATIKRFQAAGLSWPVPEDMTDAALEARLFSDAGTKQGQRRQVEPDLSTIHCELKRKHVTLSILWDEYLAQS